MSRVMICLTMLLTALGHGLEAAVVPTVDLVSVADPSFAIGSGNGSSFNSVMSADGRFVAFSSTASDLALGVFGR